MLAKGLAAVSYALLGTVTFSCFENVLWQVESLFIAGMGAYAATDLLH